MSLSRFQIVEAHQTLSPNKCVCGAWSGPFFDLGIDIDDGHGVVYLCKDCFVEAASQIDYRSPEQYKTVVMSNNELRAENNELKDRLEKLEHVFNSLGNLSQFTLPVAGGDSRPNNGETGNSQQEFNGAKSTGEEGSSQQADGKRSSDVLDDDSLNDFLSSI